MRFAGILFVAVIAAVALLPAGGSQPAQAFAIREWTGGALTPNWTDPGNWEGNAVPVDGDFAVFGPLADNRPRELQNDIVGLSLARLLFSDERYTITGNSLEITELIGVSDDSDVELELAITGPGEIIVGPETSLELLGNNSFTGNIDVRGILEVASNFALGTGSGYTRTNTPGYIQINPNVTTIGSEHLLLQGNGSLDVDGGNGALLVYSEELTISELTIIEDSLISAVGRVDIPGGFQTFLDAGATLELRFGEFRFFGPSDENLAINLTYGADIDWNSTANVMQINTVPFVPEPGAPPFEPPLFSRLWGSGTFGEANILTGEISPRSGNSPTRLTLTDDLWIKNAAFNVRLDNTTPGTGYSQLVVGDRVSLDSEATLEVEVSFSPADDQKFFILLVTRPEVVIEGTFEGLPEGATFNLEGRPWTITYQGGDGNDIVISPTGPADPRPYKRTLPMVAKSP